MGSVVQRIEMSWSGRLPPQNTQKLQKNKGLHQKENFGVEIRYLTTVYDKHVFSQRKDFVCTGQNRLL